MERKREGERGERGGGERERDVSNIVNDTPHIILDKIDTHSLNGFTNYVKLFLLQTYQDTCTVPNCYVYVRS